MKRATPQYDQLIASVNNVMNKYQKFQQTISTNLLECNSQIQTINKVISEKTKALLVADVSGDAATKVSLEAEIEDAKARLIKQEQKKLQYNGIDAASMIRDEFPALYTAYRSVEPERMRLQDQIRVDIATITAQIVALNEQLESYQQEAEVYRKNLECDSIQPLLRILPDGMKTFCEWGDTK